LSFQAFLLGKTGANRDSFYRHTAHANGRYAHLVICASRSVTGTTFAIYKQHSVFDFSGLPALVGSPSDFKAREAAITPSPSILKSL
jgi:hypothetical protein